MNVARPHTAPNFSYSFLDLFDLKMGITLLMTWKIRITCSYWLRCKWEISIIFAGDSHLWSSSLSILNGNHIYNNYYYVQDNYSIFMSMHTCLFMMMKLIFEPCTLGNSLPDGSIQASLASIHC